MNIVDHVLTPKWTLRVQMNSTWNGKLNQVLNTVRQHTQARSPNRNIIQSPPDTSSGPRLSYLPALLLSQLSRGAHCRRSLAGIYTYFTAMALDYGVKRVRSRVTGPETYPVIFW